VAAAAPDTPIPAVNISKGSDLNSKKNKSNDKLRIKREMN
jgi:hypothetical protein